MCALVGEQMLKVAGRRTDGGALALAGADRLAPVDGEPLALQPVEGRVAAATARAMVEEAALAEGDA